MKVEIAVLVGVFAAALLIVIARAVRREMLVYGVGLAWTGFAYVLLGLQRGAPSEHLGFELVGGALFGIAAILGVRRWPLLLALGWTAHVAWDLFFHYANGPSYAPASYAWFCVGFDLLIGGYILGLVARTARRAP